MSDVDDAVMEIDGHLDLACSKCGAHAQLQRPTYAECWQVTKDWLFDGVAYWCGEAGGRLVQIESARADDQLTANNDDGGDVDAAGTMGWLETAADDDDHHQDEAPTSCTHQWLITNAIGETGEDWTDDAEIELRCPQCQRRATVERVTYDEFQTIIKAWTMGMVLEWGDLRRVQLPEDLRPPAVADLVNTLDLFGDDDDDDIPF